MPKGKKSAEPTNELTAENFIALIAKKKKLQDQIKKRQDKLNDYNTQLARYKGKKIEELIPTE